MTSLYLRSSLRDTVPSGSIPLGPLSAGRAGGIDNTVTRYLDYPHAPRQMLQSIANIGTAVYAADKMVSRTVAQDSWTRDLHVSVPVSNDFPALEREIEHALRLLTGDRWAVDLRREKNMEFFPTPFISPEMERYDHVGLFSGGLDSLTGALEAIRHGKSALLVGHYDNGTVAGTQKQLVSRLHSMSEASVRLVQFRVSPRPSLETTTRSRTVLFLSLAMLVADGHSVSTPVQIAENGFIGLNIPLSGARVGSYTTRTTHPSFMRELAAIAQSCGAAGFDNPYALKTKGEVLERLLELGAARELTVSSQSCSKAGARRFQGMDPRTNCGCCYPCMMRRAALNRVGFDAGADYWQDAFGESAVLGTPALGRDLRALLTATRHAAESDKWIRRAVASSGAPVDGMDQYVDVIRRGFGEIVALVDSSGCEAVKSFLWS